MIGTEALRLSTQHLVADLDRLVVLPLAERDCAQARLGEGHRGMLLPPHGRKDRVGPFEVRAGLFMTARPPKDMAV